MTDQNAVVVSSDALALFRKVVLEDLYSVAETLSFDARHEHNVAPACEQVEEAIAVYRALAVNTEAYPRTAVVAAAKSVIADAASRVRDDALSLDEAEILIRRARQMEALVAA